MLAVNLIFQPRSYFWALFTLSRMTFVRKIFVKELIISSLY